jgi:hypothetical protein
MSVRKVFWIFILILPVAFSACKSDPGPDLVVIDTFTAPAYNASDTYLLLNDSGGSLIDEDDNGNPDQTNHQGCSRIVITGGLPSGTYYIRVNNPTGTGNANYGIRVLDYDPGVSFPVITPANDNDGGVDDNDVGGVPTAPVSINLGQVISSSIYPLTPLPGDVDWYKLVLP